MCSTLSIDSSRNKGSVCELNLLLVMILRAFFCNVNIRLHSKPQAVMQKYICGKIKELYCNGYIVMLSQFTVPKRLYRYALS